MKQSTIIALLLFAWLNSCKESTEPSNGQILSGTWEEEFIWYSPFSSTIPEDTMMIKKSRFTFQGNTFTLKIIPAHRMFVNKDSSMDIIYSDTLYNGTFSIWSDTVGLFYDNGINYYSTYLRYRIQQELLYIEHMPMVVILGQTYYIATVLPWAASSNKHSGVFSRVQ